MNENKFKFVYFSFQIVQFSVFFLSFSKNVLWCPIQAINEIKM